MLEKNAIFIEANLIVPVRSFIQCFTSAIHILKNDTSDTTTLFTHFESANLN